MKNWARRCKRDLLALYLVARDPRTPWYVKLLVAGIVAYAFSPVDLIPDFIPVIGSLDDIILIPLGIVFVIKLIPGHILAECREEAEKTLQDKKTVNWVAGAIIIFIWIALGSILITWSYKALC